MGIMDIKGAFIDLIMTIFEMTALGLFLFMVWLIAGACSIPAWGWQ